MPESLHELVKARADEAGVSLTAYVLSVLETDLNTESHSRASLSSLALRVRAIEEHLGLDSRHPGFLRTAAAKGSATASASSDQDGHSPVGDGDGHLSGAGLRRRASDPKS